MNSQVHLKRWLTVTYLFETMVNKPWLTDNEQLAYTYNSRDEAEMALPQKSDYSATFGANGISAPKNHLDLLMN